MTAGLDRPEALRPRKQRSLTPYEFVLDDALTPCRPHTRPMFGSEAVYVEDKIASYCVRSSQRLWNTKSLRRELPSMRSIKTLGKPLTGWQVLPARSCEF